MQRERRANVDTVALATVGEARRPPPGSKRSGAAAALQSSMV